MGKRFYRGRHRPGKTTRSVAEIQMQSATVHIGELADEDSTPPSADYVKVSPGKYELQLMLHRGPFYGDRR